MERYISRAANLAQEAGKFSKRLTQEIVEKSREVGLPGHLYDTSEDKIQEIKTHLDSKFDKEKIDGLKRLIAMISKGRNVSEFFPDVVKNVASASFEVRKLVYIYLLRYAEQEPDLALLSINTFQKDLSDKNPLIRAMALRVMSSIRVPVIASIIMLALKRGMADLSPYVRKAAANAIPKCYSLDPSQKEQLVELIEGMLKDNSTLVLGSVISSMCQVCPERVDLIHAHYRKLCKLLIDADEWGQVEILSLLLRYARQQFMDPNAGRDPSIKPSTPAKASGAFYSDDEDSGQKTREASQSKRDSKAQHVVLDPDHELLLRSCKPLLFSRNPAVVISVVKICFYLAPIEECQQPAKALLRILRSSREESYVALLTIVTIAQQHPDLFRPYIRHFYVYAGEPACLRDVKLEILGLLATEANVTTVLREFKDYVRSPEKVLVLKSIQVLGRLSCRIPDVAEEALRVLMALVSCKDEEVVAEAVVVTRHLIQLHPQNNTRTIVHLFKAMDSITIGMARASILWLIGQHCDNVPKIAPDALRKGAKQFAMESAIVKLQVLNLGAKLVTVDPTDVNLLLFGYVLNLARFDLDYDIRDRARCIRALVYEPVKRMRTSDDGETMSTPLLAAQLKNILLGSKALPVPENPYAGRERFTIGTLSHSLNQLVLGYEDLPAWPTEKPDPSVRHVEELDENWNRDRVVTSGVKQLNFQPKTKKKRVVDLTQFYESSASEESAGAEEEEEGEEEEEEEFEGDEEEDETEEDEDERDEDDDEKEEDSEVEPASAGPSNTANAGTAAKTYPQRDASLVTSIAKGS
ncbi:AP-3 complex subunit beta-1 [Rhizophlyctis rosea]|uniref:AP-3 complex subunit beta-1 n=1 Tax=Rhizophlyctis rosea TaxID=64517 RepID=A0AAD5SRX8_9FUNG|nr:AP-3 complex subunit beta-1 [Rhizophlyctis rosea]